MRKTLSIFLSVVLIIVVLNFFLKAEWSGVYPTSGNLYFKNIKNSVVCLIAGGRIETKHWPVEGVKICWVTSRRVCEHNGGQIEGLPYFPVCVPKYDSPFD